LDKAIALGKKRHKHSYPQGDSGKIANMDAIAALAWIEFSKSKVEVKE
jgi:hypothetical protein